MTALLTRHNLLSAALLNSPEKGGPCTHMHTHTHGHIYETPKCFLRASAFMLLLTQNKRMKGEESQNRHENHRKCTSRGKKKVFCIHPDLTSCRSCKGRNNSVEEKWFLRATCVFLPGSSWQLGSFSFQSASGDAAPAPSGQNLSPGCPTSTKPHIRTIKTRDQIQRKQNILSQLNRCIVIVYSYLK